MRAPRSRTLSGLAALFAGAMLMVATTQSVSATPPDPEHKVTICHRTNSDENPYTQIPVDEAAADGQSGNNGQQPDHYGEHQGPIWNPTLKAQKIEWGDIIPPVSPHHEGLNWSAEGQAIYRNGCAIPSTTTTVPETTTTTESTTTTVMVTTTISGVIDVPEAPIRPAAAARAELPHTGTGLWITAALALGLIILGMAVLRRSRIG
jgi:LPXTG-motif cell wall-anchored protein